MESVTVDVGGDLLERFSFSGQTAVKYCGMGISATKTITGSTLVYTREREGEKERAHINRRRRMR